MDAKFSLDGMSFIWVLPKKKKKRLCNSTGQQTHHDATPKNTSLRFYFAHFEVQGVSYHFPVTNDKSPWKKMGRILKGKRESIPTELTISGRVNSQTWFSFGFKRETSLTVTNISGHFPYSPVVSLVMVITNENRTKKTKHWNNCLETCRNYNQLTWITYLLIPLVI